MKFRLKLLRLRGNEMPFKSEAHKRKIAELVKQGRITQKVYDAFASETTQKKLPERVGGKPHSVDDLRRRFGGKK